MGMERKRSQGVNMRNVASRAGVSIATVSRFINTPEKVSPDARRRVQRVMDELGYVPNELAKAMLAGYSKVIGLLVPSVINPFFAELATNIEKLARQKGYSLILVNTQDDEKIERQSVETLLSYRVSAIVVCRSQLHDFYKNITVPVICFENPVEGCKAIIKVDNREGGNLAFQHLVNIGCKNILHIKGPPKFSATEDRYVGFKQAYEEIASSVDVKLDVVELKSDFRGNVSESELEFIDNFSDYDGIFVFNDIMATALLRTLSRKGIEVPRDVNVIGFDGSHLSQMTAPSLSTISQNSNLIAESCMEAVEYFSTSKSKIKNLSQPLVFDVPAEFIKGDSTRNKYVGNLEGGSHKPRKEEKK